MQQDYVFAADQLTVPIDWAPAGKGQRFGNYLIDIAAFYLGCIGAGILVGIGLSMSGNVHLLNGLEGPFSTLVGMLLLSLYYFVLEATTGRTIGKLFTRTRVIMADGSRITTRAALIRSLCRLIPFEAFSFLGDPESGLHDRLSKTRVVRIDRDR
ncbi:RDD family protein [Hymenobacter sp. BT175]|uniref:RDD family protein n=1 Tax=Hymenobacter translucens TaxID=2886507 RepID=UPI001D0E5A40|nr:RDD family protein [Hymenobacter translucens]MCC2547084.1 RDD family protein [Hymenobacter translucens]